MKMHFIVYVLLALGMSSFFSVIVMVSMSMVLTVLVFMMMSMTMSELMRVCRLGRIADQAHVISVERAFTVLMKLGFPSNASRKESRPTGEQHDCSNTYVPAMKQQVKRAKEKRKRRSSEVNPEVIKPPQELRRDGEHLQACNGE